MEQWRESGFVPDSEDEEEYESQPTGIPEQGQSEHDGLNVVQDGHTPETQEEDGKIGDDQTERGHGTLEPQVVIQLPEPSKASSDVNVAEDLEHDPLQDNEGLRTRHSKPSQPDLSVENPPKTPTFLAHVPSDGNEPQSSPDELQFPEHFPTRRPVTPPGQLLDGVSSFQTENEIPSSSPLSPAPSNVERLLSFHSISQDQGQDNTLDEIPEIATLVTTDDLPPSTTLGRTLRPRNPAQINPFLLEYARYEKACRDAGIQPERYNSFRRASPQRTNETKDDGSQGENIPPSSSPSQPFRFSSASPSAANTETTKPINSYRSSGAGHQPTNIYRDGSERYARDVRLPESKTAYSGYKRRKLTHPDGGQGENNSTPANRRIHQTTLGDRDTDNEFTGDTSIFDVPISPPPSGSPTTAYADADISTFRFPYGFTPPPVPTPATEKRKSHPTENNRNVVFVGSSSEPEPDMRSFPQQDNETHSGTETSDDETSEMRHTQRRIKGVLPASWLRFDIQEQEKRTRAQAEKEKLKRRRNDRHTGKGIAQRISGRPKGRKTEATAFLPSDDSDEDENDGPPRPVQRSILESIEFDNSPGLDEEDDIPEDNRIDYMNPPVSRQRRKRNKGNAPRPKGINNISSRPQGSPRPRKQRQTRITSTNIRKVKPKPRVPKLGILDAPGVRDQPVRNQPQFLRVAARQARSRRNKGRSSPTRKVLRLGTGQDTKDANSTLREWRQGTIRPTPTTDSRKIQQEPRSRRNDHAHFNGEESAVPVTGPAASVQSDLPASYTAEERTGIEARSAAEVSVNDDGGGLSNKQRENQANNKKRQRWAVRKGYVLSSLKRDAPRPADLDYATASNAAGRQPTSFQQSLSTLNASYRSTKSSGKHNYPLPLARFLSHTADAQQKRQSPKLPSTRKSDDRQQSRRHVGRQVARKRKPQHINAEAFEYRQPPVPQPGMGPVSAAPSEVSDAPALKGLHSIGPMYSFDLDTSPLKMGTFFHLSTFIGSGEFSRSLNVSTRDMDVNNGQATISCNGQTYRWGYWSEAVSSEVEVLFDTIIGTTAFTSDQVEQTEDAYASSRSLELYRSFISYINVNLSFMDSVDRRIFVGKCLKLLSKMTDASHRKCDQDCDQGENIEHHVRIEAFNLVFANQVLQIAAHELVERARLGDVVEKMTKFAIRVFRMVVSDAGMRNIRHALEENKLHEQREAGLKEKYPFVEAYLMAQKIVCEQTTVREQLREDPLSKALIDPALLSRFEDARHLEKVWLALFSIQPLQELDEFGILQPGLRFRRRVDQWKIVKQLIFKVFEAYEASPRMQSPLNNYIRSLFHRTFNLIQGWGWRHCNLILQVLFDFFARNMLHNLNNEETHGSPSFLDQLGTELRIDVDSRDSAFHLLLKIIATGLSSMSKFHEEKYIRNLVWRLLPNHGRTYPKEDALRQEDLDALRNHHDLFCTLYGSTSAGCRPPLKTVRHLVQPASSHGEACSINIHTWLRLIKFKLSTGEDNSDITEFATWHSDFMTEILNQHSLARTEVEAQKSKLGSSFIPRFAENAIDKNQRRVESLISSALVCMKAAIEATRNADQAKTLILSLPLKRVLGLFNPKSRRLGDIVCQVLDVIMIYTATLSRSSTPEAHVAVETSEDSQEYGDWSGIAEIYEEMQDPSPESSPIDDSLRLTLSQFVSRCFGEDQVPDDSVLLKVIDCWTSVAVVLVKNGSRQWRSYLNPYDADSWMSLRSTDQTRRFMPHFLAKMVEKDSSSYADCQSQLLTSWMASLVERGSMLKYQHQLTNGLLNEDDTNPLFENLPLSVNRQSGCYEISLDEICQRRVSLISCLLSNMREHLFELERQAMATGSGVGNQYSDMVRALMVAMKQNYEELGNGNELRGSYVDFVHRIVEFLQQHSQGICPLDDFFTDPTSFPLPASDPAYIVGKLKSYGVRLCTGKTAKQLVTFIQSVSERAAVDDQQSYLVDQLYNAMSHTFETGNYEQPTLCIFLLHCIFPAYVESSFTNPAAWILVKPFLQSITRTFADTILDIDSTNAGNLGAVIDSIRTYFEAVDHSLQILVDRPDLLERYSVLLTLASFLETVIASLSVIDYLDRITDEATVLVAYIEHFKKFALFAISSLLDPPMAVTPEPFDVLFCKYNDPCSHHPRLSLPAYFAETRGFATRELQTWLRDGWSVYEGKYFVRRGQQSKEIHVNSSLKSVDVAEDTFVRNVETFFGTMEMLDAFEFLKD